MDILSIAIIIFCIMETGNVMILYFMPDSRLGNGVAVFDSWHEAKKDSAMDLFAHYMAYWVAGVKLIFIFLLLVVLFTGTQQTKIWAVAAMILSHSHLFLEASSPYCKTGRYGKNNSQRLFQDTGADDSRLSDNVPRRTGSISVCNINFFNIFVYKC